MMLTYLTLFLSTGDLEFGVILQISMVLHLRVCRVPGSFKGTQRFASWSQSEMQPNTENTLVTLATVHAVPFE